MYRYTLSVAKKLIKIETPITYDNIERAMSVQEDLLTQKHSYSVNLHAVPSINELARGYIEVKLIETVILRYWDDGRIEVNAGNYFKKFTMMYLNDWLRGVACVTTNGRAGWMMNFNGESMPFFNNMILNTTTGKIEGIAPDFEQIKAYNKMIDKKIVKWLKQVPCADLPDIIEYAYMNSYGCEDCVHEKEHQTYHLLSHLEHFDYPGWLFLNAYINNNHTSNFYSALQWDASAGSKPMMYNNFKEPHVTDRTRKYVTRYLRRRLYAGPIVF
jgi:hypothetical protein